MLDALACTPSARFTWGRGFVQSARRRSRRLTATLHPSSREWRLIDGAGIVLCSTNRQTQQLVCLLLCANQKIFLKLELNVHLNEQRFFDVIGLGKSIISVQFMLLFYSDSSVLWG